VLLDVMIVADEVDRQLAESVRGMMGTTLFEDITSNHPTVDDGPSLSPSSKELSDCR
jgi:hypothetical protein